MQEHVLEVVLVQVHIVADLALLPMQTHTSVAVPTALQIHALVNKAKAVHVQLALPPPIVNETG